MIGESPGVEIGHPGLDQRPGGIIGPDAGLGQKLGRRYPGFMDVGLPQIAGESQASKKIKPSVVIN